MSTTYDLPLDVFAIEQLCVESFPRAGRKKLSVFAFQVYSLMYHGHFKSAFLIDGQLCFLLKEVRGKLPELLGKLGNCDLKILQVEDDFFLINASSIIASLESRLNCSSDYVYIDVSHRLNGPRLMQFTSVKQILEELSRHFQTLAGTTNVAAKLPVESASWNLTLVFGILLDYPTAYSFSDETCLSGIDLTLYEIKVKIRPCKDEAVFTLSSFTFPKVLRLEGFVDEWYEKKFTRCPCDKLSVFRAVSRKNLNALTL